MSIKPIGLLTIILLIVTLAVSLPTRAAAVTDQSGEKPSPALPASTRQCPAIFIPTVLHELYAPPCGPNNNYCEDYDSHQTAYGPLAPGHTYTAYPDDTNDWYYIKLPEATAVTVEVRNYYAVGQLQVRDADLNLIAFRESLPDGTMQVTLSANQVKKGVNFIWVYTAGLANNQTLYSLTVTYSVPPPLSDPSPLPNYMVLDSFEGANTNWWTPDSGVFTYTVSTEQARWGAQSLKVQYAKSNTFQFIGTEIPSAQRDISWAQTLDVWAYGVVTLSLTLQEEDPLAQQTFGPLVATNHAGWSLLQFDLRNATGIDMSQIKSVLLLVAPGDPTAAGTFFLDEIVFKDHFGLLEDFERFRYLDWWTPDPQVFTYSDTEGFICQPMKVIFEKSAPYQFIAGEIPPGLRDFSWAQVFEVWVYGDIALLLTLEDEQGNQADLATSSPPNPQGWSLLRFNFTGVSSQVDLAHIRNVLFFPYPGNPSASGQVYLDNLALSDRP